MLEETDEFKDLAAKGIDWSPLTEDWNKNQGFYAPTAEALAARAKWVRNFVRDRPENHILLVGHGGIFREIDGRSRSNDPAIVMSLSVRHTCFTAHLITNSRFGSQRWGNVECRLYTFLSNDDEDAIMVPIDHPSLVDQASKPIDPHSE